ncbi:MAG: type I restriction enzyme HsdR N-terminal domain-containing protein [Verrucomicrobia bacterium]|nr:type I restriction enzyme HsdR N-terminal domain-containing protein [Verrucomicrobiota bacterium]
MQKVFDPVRSKWVAATPEEIVRQQWIHKMIHELGYPREYIAVEKEVPQMLRRIDILVYSRAFQPLLLVECKAEKLSSAAFDQVVGYNASFNAPYLALVSADQMFLRPTLDHFPTYEELHG